MEYSPIIRQVLVYIENNLQNELNLEVISKEFGYSKFHFSRIFKNELRKNLAEYIRMRRVSTIASLLLNTDEKILDIAYYFHFNSQEALTRAFKELYHLPPGQYRKFMKNINYKEEEKTMEKKQEIKGWFLSGSHPFNYEMGLDKETFHSGKAAGYLKSISVSDYSEFATMMQECKADSFLGKRVKLTSFIKSKNVQNHCAMWMRVDDSSEDVLQFDNMHDRPIKGNTEWNVYSIVLDIAENSKTISFGILLLGTGTVWADNFEFEIVDESVPTTNFVPKSELLAEPTNLSFEDE